MRPDEVDDLLEAVRDKRTSVEEALVALRHLPIDELGFARPDVHRELRQGLPEAIYAEGKTPQQTIAIAERMLAATTGPVITTRTPEETIAALEARWPDAEIHRDASVVVLRSEATAPAGIICIVSAGTSDGPVAAEAAVVASVMGAKVERISDVGVAGLHRVLEVQDSLMNADAVIVVAGMEGALPSIVGGLTPAPVIAVPTSVGYGASFDGLAALLGMLNSCAAGVVVCNIDNGFGAAMFALKMLRSRR